MKKLHPGSFWLNAALLAGTAMCGVVCGEPTDPSSSNTVLGANPQLSEGAEAMLNGDWKRGIQLTEMGIAATVSREDRATGLANLCAGYAAIKEYRKALDFCNQSLAIEESNWRAWQNRAACHLHLGNIEESLRDIQRGLVINPDSDALQKTLAIARDYEKQKQERIQHLLES